MPGRRNGPGIALVLVATASLVACTSTDPDRGTGVADNTEGTAAAAEVSAHPTTCAGQPESFSPISASTLARLRGKVPTRVQLVKRAPASVVPAAQAARPPWTNCASRRLTSWELSLARVSLQTPCRNDREGVCRPLYTHRLMYVEVRHYFGDGQRPRCCPGNPQPVACNVDTEEISYFDARTGDHLHTTVR